MRFEDARRFALALPEAAESPHHDMGSFRVRGKIFATVPPQGGLLHVFVDDDGVAEAVAEAPGACEELWWGKRLSGVRVHLDAAPDALVEELLVDAWRRKAPKALATAYDAEHPGPR